jgi:hypothetical protein
MSTTHWPTGRYEIRMICISALISKISTQAAVIWTIVRIVFSRKKWLWAFLNWNIPPTWRGWLLITIKLKWNNECNRNGSAYSVRHCVFYRTSSLHSQLITVVGRKIRQRFSLFCHIFHSFATECAFSPTRPPPLLASWSSKAATVSNEKHCVIIGVVGCTSNRRSQLAMPSNETQYIMTVCQSRFVPRRS